MSNNTNNFDKVNNSSFGKTSAHETSVVLTYEGANITFQKGENVMVSATQMAKPFGKSPKFWLNNQYTVDYLSELTKVRNLTLTDLVEVKFGGSNPGTWFHQDVALEFARWLSPAFAIWTNDMIKELLTTGVTTVNDDDEVIAQAMNVLQKRLDASKQKVQMLESENEVYKGEIKQLAPKAAYTDEVLQSTSTFTVTQIAKDLGMGAVTLNKLLKQYGIQFYQSGQWFLYAKYQNKGYTDMRIAMRKNEQTGEYETYQSMVWTEKGRKFILELIAKQTAINTQITKGGVAV